jgi:TetR/AcrR family transcriptional regulator, transcriptional repressor for nem operon
MVDTVTPARRLTARGQATRLRILRAAADLVLRNGVTGTHLEDVRREAGVSGSQLTHYFRDKHTLITAVIVWQAEAVLEEYRVPELGDLDTFAAWRLWADGVVDLHRSREFRGGCEFGSLAGQLVEADEEFRTLLADGYEQWISLFRRGLSAMRDRGDLRPDADPDALALATLSAMQGGVLLSQTLRSAEPLTASVQAAVARIESFRAG